MEIPFPDQLEFKRIQSLVDGSASHPALELGIGDDTAILRSDLLGPKLLWAQDQMCEGVHFNMEWSSPSQLAHKLWVSNLSDLEAMGGTAQFALLSLALPKSWAASTVDALLGSLKSIAKTYDVQIVGGDTTSAQSACLGLSLMGNLLSKPLLRSGLKAGHGLYLSKMPGSSLAGLHALQGGLFAVKYGPLVQEHLAPSFQAGFGPWLAAQTGVGGAMDLSDDLLISLEHLSLASGVKLCVQVERLIPSELLSEFALEYDLDPYALMLSSGEEYGLLFSADASQDWVSKALANQQIFHIGQVEKGSGVELKFQNQPYLVENLGFKHF